MHTWADIVRQHPKTKLGLSYKAGLAFGQQVAKLNKSIPGLTDTLGLQQLPFDYYDFLILETDTRKRASHKVAIIYRTATLTLFETIGENLLVALGDATQFEADAFFETFLLKLQPNLSIWSYLALPKL